MIIDKLMPVIGWLSTASTTTMLVSWSDIETKLTYTDYLIFSGIFWVLLTLGTIRVELLKTKKDK